VLDAPSWAGWNPVFPGAAGCCIFAVPGMPRSLKISKAPAMRYCWNISCALCLLLPATGRSVLLAGDFRHVAIASPQLVPYGAAALAVLEALGIAGLPPKPDHRGEDRAGLPVRGHRQCRHRLSRTVAAQDAESVVQGA
jgi:hypothetical protein